MTAVIGAPRLSRRIGEGAFLTFCWLATGIAILALAAILWSLLSQGIGGLDLDIFTKSTPAPGSEGGLLNAILGSLMMCIVAMIGAVFIGVLAGTWLSEFARDSQYGKVIRFLNDVLLSAPSILIGLFIYEILVAPLGGFSGLAGSVALALIAAPVITRTTEDVLRLQPIALREASVALGAPVWSTILTVIWKAAQGGMLTGALLAFARISGETAPLLFTALNNQFLSLDMTKPTANLPVVIFNFALSAYDDWRRLAWAGALLIAATVLTVTIVARILAREPRRS
ncbi:MAG: phosphate ABC transporter permease PstA [Phenylobacterium sp.]|uniref:phosphate ABC transporter permease PstA n=1 Tax=Phenylobacterium sp. TaxID=1871053 RepID=UPI001213C58E|nr:phosphate ABC transporter permease PstA [Phenylobacterium sp.]TAJ73948.1 MAG: phosphate ABC transporter permease PstA [Phenylobacterium sp.]